jgi:hypothetical protein
VEKYTRHPGRSDQFLLTFSERYLRGTFSLDHDHYEHEVAGGIPLMNSLHHFDADLGFRDASARKVEKDVKRSVFSQRSFLLVILEFSTKPFVALNFFHGILLLIGP